MKLLETNINSESPISHLLIRNSKDDVVSLDGKEVFPKRTTRTIKLRSISMEEKKFYELFDDYLISIYDDARIQGMQRGFKLVITILRKKIIVQYLCFKKNLIQETSNVETNPTY